MIIINDDNYNKECYRDDKNRKKKKSIYDCFIFVS